MKRVVRSKSSEEVTVSDVSWESIILAYRSSRDEWGIITADEWRTDTFRLRALSSFTEGNAWANPSSLPGLLSWCLSLDFELFCFDTMKEAMVFYTEECA